MDCCQKAVTAYIIQEAKKMCTLHQGRSFAEQMISEAGISVKNPEDLALIKEYGAEEMMANLFGK